MINEQFDLMLVRSLCLVGDTIDSRGLVELLAKKHDNLLPDETTTNPQCAANREATCLSW